MLYKLILVDDERKIRETLSRIIDWKSLGFEIAGTFESAERAIRYIDNHIVDCVLSDIRMTNMSGMDLAEYLFKNKPHIKIVLISGYQDFEYAFNALKFNVSNYLLKPTKPSDLSSAFLSIKNSLDIDSSYLKIYSQYKRDLFNDIIVGFYANSSKIGKLIEDLNIGITLDTGCAIAELEIKNYERVEKKILSYGKEAFTDALQKIVDEGTDNAFGIILSYNEQSIKYIIFNAKKNSQTAKNHIKKTIFHLADLFNIKSELINVVYFDSIRHLTVDALSLPDKENINTINLLKSNKMLIKQQQLFLRLINSGDISGVFQQLNVFFAELKGYKLAVVKSYMLHLILFVFEEMLSLDIDFKNIANVEDLQASLLDSTDLKQLYSYACMIFKSITEYISNNKSSSVNKIINRAKEFIIENCCENISLDDVAAHVHLSPNYFSRIFKQYTEQTYINFLIRCRIDKAKEYLINTDLKIYEISSMVGYDNLQFFSRLFKSFEKLTPKEYRNKFVKE